MKVGQVSTEKMENEEWQRWRVESDLSVSRRREERKNERDSLTFRISKPEDCFLFFLFCK